MHVLILIFRLLFTSKDQRIIHHCCLLNWAAKSSGNDKSLVSHSSLNVFLLHTLSATLHNCPYRGKADHKAMNVSQFFSFLAEKNNPPGKAVWLRELVWKHAVTEPAFCTCPSPGPTLAWWQHAGRPPVQTSWAGVWLGDVTQSLTWEKPK